ncbi:MAG: farnesyl-diphosphate synthase [Firmicutes bacterium HGW-Firmicutes-7]|nr:MAG: farnesyl-diphosphate synthase [Firmicutes bacterium HGW-Firmicutes-7]
MIEFKVELNKRIEYIISVLNRYLPAHVKDNQIVVEAMAYSVFAGGKRMRPIFMLETFNILNGKGRKIESFMAAIEMIHTYSLIHDDLPALDNDDLRRGIPTCHVKYGENIAILAGDALLNRAFEVIIEEALINPEIGIIKAMVEIGKASGTNGMIGGQVADILNENKPIDIELLNYIHLHKTSAMIEASFVVGALLANASETEIEIFRKIGKNIGLAFQIQDDLLDVMGTEDELGKPINSDQKNKKITYVALKGVAESTQIVYEQLEEAVEHLKSFDLARCEFLLAFIDYLKTRNH